MIWLCVCPKILFEYILLEIKKSLLEIIEGVDVGLTVEVLGGAAVMKCNEQHIQNNTILVQQISCKENDKTNMK